MLSNKCIYNAKTQKVEYIPLTAEELEQMKKWEGVIPEEIQETMEDRLAKLEKSFSKIAELLEKLGVK